MCPPAPGAEGGPAGGCIVVRFIGRAVVEGAGGGGSGGGGGAGGAASAIRGYQFAQALPPFLARLTGSGAVLAAWGADEAQSRLDEEALVDAITR